MKKIFIVTLTLTMLLTFSTHADADLNLLGQGTSTYGTYNLIYDTELDISWYDFTSPDNVWIDLQQWADNLTVTFGSNVYDDWRMPVVFDECWDWYCTNSEMGQLYYTALGNAAGGPLNNTGDFQNLTPTIYVTGSPQYQKKWFYNFNFNSGYAYITEYTVQTHTLAVRSGRAVVPEPMSMVLFGVGGATIGFRRFRNRN